MNKRTNKSHIYNRVIQYLLLYCSLQEVIIPIIYRVTGNYALSALVFYQKDVLLIILFFWSLPRIASKNLRTLSLFYLSYVFLSLVLSLLGYFNYSISFSTIISNIRNTILLPTFCCIGSSIEQADDLIEFIENKWFPFVVFMALIGLIEFVLDKTIGTVLIWKNYIGYTRYYIDIKKQTASMINGLPGNFYGDYGNGYFSTKRLVGFWANPLTAAYSLMPACFFYFVKCTKVLKRKRIRKNDIFTIIKFLIIFIAIYLTKTRAILFLLLLGFSIYIFVNVKKNAFLFFIMFIAIILAFFITDFDSIRSFIIDGSTYSHIFAISNSLEKIKTSFLGHGLGYLGIYGESATESAYLTLLGNLGLIGLILYISIFIKGIANSRMYLKSALGQTVMYCSLAYFITGFISEQLFAFTSIMQFYILLGLMFPVVYRQKTIDYLNKRK